MKYPLTFQPVFVEKIWGSRRLETLYNKKLPEDKPIGESWEIAALDAGCCRVANGPWQDMSLKDLIQEHGTALGFLPEQCTFPFGLLIKLLDANEELSVQVHPDADACKVLPDAHLKTECWTILHAEPGAVIYKGLQRGVRPDQLRQAIEDGSVEQLLRRIDVSTGDFHYLPAGTIHALGAGVIVAEVQTPSDTTYRVYDWGRVGPDGKPRQLHVEQALQSVRFEWGDPPTDLSRAQSDVTRNLVTLAEDIGKAELLTAGDFFSVVRARAQGRHQAKVHLHQPVVMMVLHGEGDIQADDDYAERTSFTKGSTVLLPATAGSTIHFTDDSEFLLTCLAGPD